jgi:transposase
MLTDIEREQLKIRHKQERDGRVRDRIKAVLLTDKGWSSEAIAEALLISDQAVRNHLRDYEATCKLKPESGGSDEKLSEEQSKKLLSHLENHVYLFVKDIIAYVISTFEIVYTVPGMRNWLRRNGFSYKKPAIVPGKANKERQAQWIEEYHKLKQGLPADEAICFTDGVHPTHNIQPAYGWIKKGVRKELPANTGRTRLNLSGAIDIIDQRLVMHEDLTLNAASTMRFFNKIEEAYPEKRLIHIFCDNAPYYRNKAVREYLKGSKIELHFLPPYSPNLNPIERLWKWMKERVVYNTYYEHFEDFKDAVFGFFSLLSSAGTDSKLKISLCRRVSDNFSPIHAPLRVF